MSDVLTPKQELFTNNLFKGMSQREAWIQAGYSGISSPAVIDVNACRLADNTKVKLRLAELRALTCSVLVADAKERRERLTIFLREDNYTKFGRSRQSNIQAADVLNKMDKIYDTAPTLVSNTTTNIIVMDKETKDLISGVKDRTGKFIEGEVIDE